MVRPMSLEGSSGKTILSLPLVLVFRHESRGVVVDAVILDEDATSILFSFAHSYFFVAIPHHRGVVDFFEVNDA